MQLPDSLTLFCCCCPAPWLQTSHALGQVRLARCARGLWGPELWLGLICVKRSKKFMATPYDNEATCSLPSGVSPTVELRLDEALCRPTSRDITIVICVVARCSGGGRRRSNTSIQIPVHTTRHTEFAAIKAVLFGPHSHQENNGHIQTAVT